MKMAGQNILGNSPLSPVHKLGLDQSNENLINADIEEADKENDGAQANRRLSLERINGELSRDLSLERINNNATYQGTLEKMDNH